MEQELTDRLVACFSNGLKPVDERPLHEWLEDKIELPNVYNPAGRFAIDFYPYLRRPMDDLLDDQIKQVNCCSCTQAGKSLLQQVFIPYIVLEAPGPILMVHDIADNAKKVVEERIIPLFRQNKELNRLLESDRFAARKSGIKLPHMPFRVDGPAESTLLGYSARYVLGDEVWRWQAQNHTDVIEKLKNRQTAYNATKKLMLASQPDFEGSEWWKECTRGHWFEYGWRCSDCNVLQLYEWNGQRENTDYGMIFDKTDSEDNYDKKASSARLVCQHCFYEVKDTATNRKRLVMDGDYILIHKGNDSSVRTYSWSQYVNVSISFKEIALKYFDAVIQRRTTGLRTKHEVFRQQTLGRFWKVGEQIDTKKLFTTAYQSSDEWKDETIRFLTLDVQQDHLFFLVRAWSQRVNESRLIDWGSIVNLSELPQLKKKYKIHPLAIGVDSGFNTRNIYAASIENGEVITMPNGKKDLARITCYKGDGGTGLTPKKFYPHKVLLNGRQLTVDKLYSTMTPVDPQFPITSRYKPFKAYLYMWSNYSIKTILFNLRDNKLNFKWGLNDRANAEYTKQMFSEELNPKSGRYEQLGDTPNHILDLEAMQLVMALQADTFHPSAQDLNDIAKSPELSPT